MINYDLSRIRAIFFDVDGVLSRQTITLHPSGEPMRTVNIKDGYAMQHAVKQISKYEELCAKYHLSDDEVMYMGDDIPDYEVMKRCGLPVCPADACAEIKAISKYISEYNGGEGCARDVIEQVLKAHNLWMHNSEAFGW